MHGVAKLRALLGVSLVVCLGLGCSGAQIEDTAYHGARGGVRGAVDEMRTLPELKELADGLKDDEKIKAAAHDLAESLVAGAGDGAKQLEIDQQVAVLIKTVFQVAQAQGNELVSSMITQQGPKLEQLARQTLSGTIRDAGAEIKRTAESDLPAATGSVIDSAVIAFADALESEKVAALKKDLIETSGKVTENASAGAVRGLREELAKPETLDAVGALAKRVVHDAGTEAKSTFDFKPIVVGLVVFLVLAVAALVFVWRQSVKTRHTLSLIVQQIEKGGADHAELKQSIRKKAVSRKLDSFLDQFLSDRGL